MAGGLALVIHGTAHREPAHTLGGTCITLTAVAVFALTLIRRWIVDTRDERRILAAAQREAIAEQSRYIAGQAALENEQGRLEQDMAAERAALAARLKAEREALAAEFAERRDSLIAETMEATVLMMKEGKLAPGQQATANLIPFPKQEPQRARTREHGVVGP